MSPSIKNLLWVVVVIAIVVGTFVLFQAGRVYDRSSEPTNFRSFTVQADAKVVGVPDVATFSFEVITEGALDVAKLQSDNATKMNAAIDFIKKQGVDAKDISTNQYSISPRYESVVCDYSIRGSVCPPAEIVGYSIVQSANVKVRDFKKISSLLTGVVTNGANSVGQVSFTIDDTSALENQARADAIKKAQEKAKSIASAGGFSVGRLLDISESGGGLPPMYYSRGVSMDMAEEKAAASPTIEPGSREINISVSLKYEIE